MPHPLTRYKIGLAAIGLLALGLFIAALVQANATKQDDHTYQEANKIAEQLDNYITDQQTVPASLAAAHITHVPAAVSYRKSSAKQYVFCVRYQTASSSRTLLSELNGYRYYATDSSPYNMVYLTADHHAGKNCQTVQPEFTGSGATNSTVTPPFVKNADGSYTVCGVHTNYFDGEGHVLQGPPTTPGAISISSTSYPYVGSRLLFIISPASQEFDENCQPLTPTDLQAGNTVSVFDITSPNAPATSIFLKRSY